jgi:hypothetical protein
MGDDADGRSVPGLAPFLHPRADNGSDQGMNVLTTSDRELTKEDLRSLLGPLGHLESGDVSHETIRAGGGNGSS